MLWQFRERVLRGIEEEGKVKVSGVGIESVFQNTAFVGENVPRYIKDKKMCVLPAGGVRQVLLRMTAV
jgi:hypothetical protein